MKIAVLALAVMMAGCVGRTTEFDPEGNSPPRQQCEVPLPDGASLLVVDLIDADCDALASEPFPDAGAVDQ